MRRRTRTRSPCSARGLRLRIELTSERLESDLCGSCRRGWRPLRPSRRRSRAGSRANRTVRRTAAGRSARARPRSSPAGCRGTRGTTGRGCHHHGGRRRHRQRLLPRTKNDGAPCDNRWDTSGNPRQISRNSASARSACRSVVIVASLTGTPTDECPTRKPAAVEAIDARHTACAMRIIGTNRAGHCLPMTSRWGGVPATSEYVGCELPTGRSADPARAGDDRSRCVGNARVADR